MGFPVTEEQQLPVSYRLSSSGAVAYVTLNNPPVNAIGADARRLLVDAVDRAEKDGAKRVILSSTGRMFSAGADTREFDKPVAPPVLPDVFDRVENSSVPWIAALHGVTLGGGCELMLSCRYRIATPDAAIGLPEVNLGLVPGAGGTQRLPRLVGAEAALSMICSGAPVTADTALTIGLVEELAEDTVAAALAVPQEKLAATAPVGQRDAMPVLSIVSEKARKNALEAKLDATAPLRAIELIEQTAGMSLSQGQAAETEVFFELRDGEQSKAMRAAFFSARKSGK